VRVFVAERDGDDSRSDNDNRRTDHDDRRTDHNDRRRHVDVSGQQRHDDHDPQLRLQPVTLTVKPGTKVTVMNTDSVTHTLTADGGAFDTGDILPGTSTTFTAPATAGSYGYHCSIHLFMKATLVVS
jgi:plastocyanin